VWSTVKQALPAAAGSIDLSLRPSYNPALKRLIGNAKPRIAGVFPSSAAKNPSRIWASQEIKTTQESKL